MGSLKKRILRLLSAQPGLTDREITDHLFGANFDQQSVNSTCRSLAKAGILSRVVKGGLIRNFLVQGAKLMQRHEAVKQEDKSSLLSEDAIKQHLNEWLLEDGWSTKVAWHKERGIDILAERAEERWIIEVKGLGGYDQMRANFFLTVLGEILQRMTDPSTSYSIAMPDLGQYRGLWERLPELAKTRTQISALFISEDGKITEA